MKNGIMILQETNINTNSEELIDGYHFLLSTYIDNKVREVANKRRKENKGNGKM